MTAAAMDLPMPDKRVPPSEMNAVIEDPCSRLGQLNTLVNHQGSLAG
jgi:hypothetical protein